VIKRIAIVLVAILVVFVGRWLFFYSGFYSATPGETPDYRDITIPVAPSAEFSDNASGGGEGTVLLDLAHDNTFDLEELNVLTSRVISRGLAVELSTGNNEDDLEEELSEANAYIVVSPQDDFSKEEREKVDEFVNDGGRLLLIADPTRPSQINQISVRFGLLFEADYLYNLVENDANYRNIFVSEFKETELTRNLERIALYTSGSITSDNSSVAIVDDNTFSSVIETRERLSPIALAREAKVLAVHDLTFFTEPHNGILDNDRLISNIADWLASPTEKEKEVEEEEEEEEEVEEAEGPEEEPTKNS
jgi:hypothetical protein